MMKYIVYWCLFYGIVLEPAPLKHDEFGRIVDQQEKIDSLTDCLHKSTFENKDSAIAFYKRAQLSRFDNNMSQKIYNLKLDSSKW